MVKTMNTIPSKTQSFRKWEEALNRKRARFFFLRKPSRKKDISQRAGSTEAKAMKYPSHLSSQKEGRPWYCQFFSLRLKSSKMSQIKTEIKTENRKVFRDPERGEAFLILKFKLSITKMKGHQAKQ
jgi:hypothetical protein